MGSSPWIARLKLTVELDRNSEHPDRSNARAVLDVDAPQLRGTTMVTAKPEIAALRGIDLDAIRSGEFSIETKLSSDPGRLLLVFLALHRPLAPAPDPP